jgi:hypothetical protein
MAYFAKPSACVCPRLFEASRLSKTAIDKTERMIRAKRAMMGRIITRALPERDEGREFTGELGHNNG